MFRKKNPLKDMMSSEGKRQKPQKGWDVLGKEGASDLSWKHLFSSV